jgi:hypothetical protein
MNYRIKDPKQVVLHAQGGSGGVWYGPEPPKKQWVSLTDEDIQDLSYLSQKIDASNSEWFDRWGFARAIEAKLKEKNT